MRAFVVMCVIAVAAAQYDYTPQNGGGIGNAGISSGSAQLSQPIQPIQPANEFNKEFFSYTASDADFDDGNVNDQIANSLRKNLRVLFIKGPEQNGLENAAVQLAKSAADDRTAIYVLSKQADISDLANKLNQVNRNNNNKPEVHFVKYRTPADAENAQRAIQSQYDALPGSSVNSNGGTAPVLDFASKGPINAAPAVSAEPSNAYAQPQATYLPPGRRL